MKKFITGKPAIKKSGVFRRLWPYIRQNKRHLFFAVFCAVLSVAGNLSGPVLIGHSIDYMIGVGQVDFDMVFRLILLIGFVSIIYAVFQWLLSISTTVLTNRVVRAMRAELFEKLSNLPLRFFDRTPHGEVISRFVNDIDAVSDGMMQGLSQLLSGVMTILGAIVFMLTINPTMTLVVLLSAPISFFVAKLVATNSQKMFKKQWEYVGEMNGYIEEQIGGQKVVKAFSMQEKTFEEFKALNQKLYGVGLRAQFYAAMTNPSTRYVNNITYTVVGVIASFLAISARISVGDISSFLIYSNLFLKPFNEISGVMAQIQSAITCARRVFDMLDLENQLPDDPNPAVIEHCEGHVSFKHVSFAYNPERPLIIDFNLDVAKGSKVAIVGHTGSGKTTLVNLLMRFYDVDEGTIEVDGVDIYHLTRDNLRRCFGMVLQETWLFKGSVRDNIAYGKPDATDEEIIAAAKAAHAHSFIKRLPEGYDTIITDSGENLSQGQKQLLTIARVMLVDPPMLILDEATSSIDTLTEVRIQKAFLKMIEGRTSFVIAHRLSTIRESDLILVLENGNIVESGTHQQLLEKGGSYWELYNSQFAK
ncbi:ABC transporter ATP-binding protein [Candidatus Soleaferrea massiliensis]|uniref:ABC transporter ATP-binding protein n=1 Tax=Candidatus Soleaferrea massiliensis TaxID=1470354 RepID=UPI000694F931|nr:ABC transporter ATP-binding protein [Candidatus Soleaferrea massiliensis]